MAHTYDLKIVLEPVRGRVTYYVLSAYDENKLILRAEKIYNPYFVLKWITYHQSLLEADYLKYERSPTGTVTIYMSRNAERHFKLLLFHALSVVNVRTAKVADRLARCWAQVDAISPVVSALWDLMYVVGEKRMANILKAYCAEEELYE